MQDFGLFLDVGSGHNKRSAIEQRNEHLQDARIKVQRAKQHKARIRRE